MRGHLRAKGLRSAMRRLRDSERGQGLVEYALIIVVVSLGTIAALTFLRDNIRGLFSAAGSSIALGDGGGSAHRQRQRRWRRSRCAESVRRPGRGHLGHDVDVHQPDVHLHGRWDADRVPVQQGRRRVRNLHEPAVHGSRARHRGAQLRGAGLERQRHERSNYPQLDGCRRRHCSKRRIGQRRLQRPNRCRM